MSATINATHTAPVGYTRSYVRPTAHGCRSHDAYRIGCGLCGYAFTPTPVTLASDVLALILDREDGSVLEYVTDDATPVNVAHLAHDGEVVLRDDMLDHPVSAALAYEATLYADCFGVPLSERFPSEAVPA